MDILTPQEMRDLENHLFQTIKFPESTIIETVGIRCADIIFQYLQEREELDHICILAGKGNNAADGVAAARHLHNAGLSVEIVYLFEESEFSKELKLQADFANSFNIPSTFIDSDFSAVDLFLDDSEILFVDAVFGIGLKNKMPKHICEIFSALNLNDLDVIAIDIPSGIDASSGLNLGDAVNADLTIVVSHLKTGHLFGDGLTHSGAIQVIDAGFPIECESDSKKYLISPSIIPAGFISTKNPFGHKHDFGNLLIIGGSSGMNGAPIMSAMSALKCGTGLVSISTTDINLQALEAKCPLEVMIKPISAIHDWNKFDAILVGPGFGVGTEQVEIIKKVLANFSNNLIFDADGLNNIAKFEIDLSEYNGSICLTPHLGEYLNLIKLPMTKFLTNPMDHLLKHFNQANLGLVVKSSCTYIKIEDRIYFFNRPNDILATAGSGDVLAGILAGLMAQNSNTDLVLRLISAVSLHSVCGELCLEQDAVKSATAIDLIHKIPEAIAILENGYDELA